MDLILWRHAEAVEGDAGDDLARKLTSKGERQAERMAEWLNRRLAHSTRILVSPAVRCQQTAKALGRKFRTRRRARARARARRRCSTPPRWPEASERGADRRPPADARPGRGAGADRRGRSRGRSRRPRVWWIRAPAARRRGPRRPAGGAVARLPLAGRRRGPRPRAVGASGRRQRRLQHADAAPGLDLLAQQVQRARMRLGPAERRAPASAGRPSPTQRDARPGRRRRGHGRRSPPGAGRTGAGRTSAPASRASSLRRPPRWPSTRSPMRRSWLCEKPGASTWAST